MILGHLIAGLALGVLFAAGTPAEDASRVGAGATGIALGIRVAVEAVLLLAFARAPRVTRPQWPPPPPRP